MRGGDGENPAGGGRAWLAPSVKLAKCSAHCLARAQNPWDLLLPWPLLRGCYVLREEPEAWLASGRTRLTAQRTAA